MSRRTSQTVEALQAQLTTPRHSHQLSAAALRFHEGYLHFQVYLLAHSSQLLQLSRFNLLTVLALSRFQGQIRLAVATLAAKGSW